MTGRTDDMFNVRGVNVFPSAVQKGVLSRPDIASGQFRIVLEGSRPMGPDRRQGGSRAAALPPTPMPGAARDLERAIRDHAGASAEVTLLAPDSLPRTDGKTALIERK